jgi:hypothetical protein
VSVTRNGSSTLKENNMGIFDKAKDLAGLKDKAEDLLEEHGDKLPEGVKDKVDSVMDKLDGLIPGQD